MTKLIKFLMDFFQDDEIKVVMWLETKNLNLGDVTPLELIKKGRLDKLLCFVETSIKSNFKEGEG